MSVIVIMLLAGALLYINRQTWEQMREELVRDNPYPNDYGRMPISQLFGIPVMLYHGIPIGQWELVQRRSGENIISGNVWESTHTYDDCPDLLMCEEHHRSVHFQ